MSSQRVEEESKFGRKRSRLALGDDDSDEEDENEEEGGAEKDDDDGVWVPGAGTKTKKKKSGKSAPKVKKVDPEKEQRKKEKEEARLKKQEVRRVCWAGHAWPWLQPTHYALCGTGALLFISSVVTDSDYHDTSTTEKITFTHTTRSMAAVNSIHTPTSIVATQTFGDHCLLHIGIARCVGVDRVLIPACCCVCVVVADSRCVGRGCVTRPLPA